MNNYFDQFVNNLKNDRPTDRLADSSTGADPGNPYADEREGVSVDIVARLAIYDTLRAAPRIIDLNADDYEEFINLLANKTYQASKELGGNVPYTVLREVIENLIHAYFSEVIISVLDSGNTIRISDQGPGIINKDKAFQPGFSTATSTMKKYIKGVGSGLPITKETISFLGGTLVIEDNLDHGTVITIKIPSTSAVEAPVSINTAANNSKVDLNKRHKKVLFLIMELGSVGPSKIASELGISLSTAYRDLVYLEDNRLIFSDEQGKRVLTSLGIEYLDELIGS